MNTFLTLWKVNFECEVDIIENSPKITFLSGVNERTVVKRTVCTFVAILIHFLILASFFWTNVMAWDIYKTFGRKTIFSR